MDPAAVSVRWASDPEELRGALALRDEVFCEEQGVPREEEVDRRDLEAMHLVALDPDGRVIGTLRLLMESGRAKVGRVAVRRDWRGHGIASRMLELALLAAREKGAREAGLAAQVEATELYRKAGFVVESEPFDDAGIPHVWMGRKLGNGYRTGGEADSECPRRREKEAEP